MLALCHHAVDTRLEEAVDSGGGEHVLAVGARRHHGQTQARVPRGLEVSHRAGVGLHPVLVDQPQHQLVLSIAQPAHRFGVRGIVGLALGQLDAPRGEERPHTVTSRLSVDILAIVGNRVERHEVFPRSSGPLAQVCVEHLLPCRSVDGRRFG